MIHADLPFQPEQIGAPAALKKACLDIEGADTFMCAKASKISKRYSVW